MNKLDGLLNIFGKRVSEVKECYGASMLVIDVPNPSHKLYIAIGQKGNIKEPHIHVFRSGNDMINWLRSVPLSLIRNSYVVHDHERVIGLTKEELYEINKVMRRRTDVVIMSQRLDITNWRYIFNTWNEYNEDYEINPQKYGIPMYSEKIVKGRSIL